MEVFTDFYFFLLSVVFISLSGVMTPGPLFVVTVAKALKDKIAGVLVSFGHGIMEFPLIIRLLFCSFRRVWVMVFYFSVTLNCRLFSVCTFHRLSLPCLL